jgi:glycosyltransferase involved in cell wall biosynthesis
MEEGDVARVCILRQYYYPQDQRLRNQIDALLGDSIEVDVICLRRPGQSRLERKHGLRIWRLPLGHDRGGTLSYLIRYGVFFVMAGVLVTSLHFVRRYKLIAAASIPDALVFAAAIPKLAGARVVLDLREAMPEFFATKFNVGMTHPMVRLIAAFEQASIRFADLAITCTEQMRQRFIERGADPGRIGVVMNSADESVFSAEGFPPAARAPDRFTLISHGSIEERYGLDTAIRALARLKDEIPELRLAIYGEGSYQPDLSRLALQLGVEDRVDFHGYVALDLLLRAIAQADAGLVAMKKDVFRDITHCLKMFEFVSMHKPVICSRTRAVEECFDDDALLYFDADDDVDLARAIRRLHASPQLGAALVARATIANARYRWPRQREIFLSLVRPLLQQDARPTAVQDHTSNSVNLEGGIRRE